MDITKGLNNLTNLYNKNDFEVIRYNLVYNSYKTSLYYTNINGLGHQTHVKSLLMIISIYYHLILK